MPRRFAPVISSLMLGRVPPPRVPRLGPLLCFAPSSVSVPVPIPSHCFSPPAPPHRHDGRGDTTGSWRFSRLYLPILAIPSVRFGIGWRRGRGRCLPRYIAPPASVSGSSSSVPPANPLARPIRFPRRPTVPSPHLPDRSTRGTGRGFSCSLGCLPVRLVRYCRSISPAAYLCWFCGGWRRGLSCLLGCRIMYLVDG